MSNPAPPAATGLLRSHIGKKALMALTGVILFGFVTVHMAGNLQVFMGAPQIDGYGQALKANPLILWGARATLLLSVLIHMTMAILLSAASRAARPTAYKKHKPVRSSYASRSMLLGGVYLLCFILFHLLHMTTGHLHPSFDEVRVYENLVSGFQVIPVAVGYLIAMVALCLHLYHGVYSLTRSLGLSHPRYVTHAKRAAIVFALVVALGFSSIPVAVLAGLLQ